VVWATRAACCSRESSFRRPSRACASSAARPTPRATSSRTWPRHLRRDRGHQCGRLAAFAAHRAIAVKIFLVGFIATPSRRSSPGRSAITCSRSTGVLMGGVAGARSHSGRAGRREGDQQFGAVGRLPGGIRRIGRAAHRVRYFAMVFRNGMGCFAGEGASRK